MSGNQVGLRTGRWCVPLIRDFGRYANMRAKGEPVASKRLVRWLLVCWILAAPPLIGKLGAQDFTYTNTNGTITITGYTGPGGNVVIPTTLSGLPVTSIGDGAFSPLTNLTGVTIPDSVTNLGDSAFAFCTSLATVTLGKGITTIKGGGAGAGSGMGTFYGCKSLTSVTIPDNVTNISDGVEIKPGIAVGAFADCSALTNVIIGNRVVYIGAGTFANCAGVTQVSIPDSVTTVGAFAFLSCGGLSDVKIGKSVTQLGPWEGYAFFGCTNLTRVVIPGNVTNLGDHTFDSCVGLAGLAIENGVTRLGSYAFAFCHSLTNVTLPASVATIDDKAFAFCTNLAGLYFKGNAAATNAPGPFGGGVFYASSKVTVYYLPGTTGWGPTYAGRPTLLWNPQVQTTDGSFGVRQNQFGFNIAGTPDIPLVVEGSTDLSTPSWLALQTCTLTNGLLYFADPQWKNYSERFYRIRSP